MKFIEGLTGKWHVGYIVEDVSTAVEGLQKKFGCALGAKPYIFASERAWKDGEEFRDLKLRIAICRINETMTFEYIQPISQEGYHYLSLISDGNSLNHICFGVEDYDRYRKDFLEHGALIMFEAEANDRQNGYRRCFYAKFKDIPGVFEIQEKPTAYRE